MDDRHPGPPQHLANNRSSDGSSDGARQMANCCRGGGGSSNSIDFSNKVTVNVLSGEKDSSYHGARQMNKRQQSVFSTDVPINVNLY